MLRSSKFWVIVVLMLVVYGVSFWIHPSVKWSGINALSVGILAIINGWRNGRRADAVPTNRVGRYYAWYYFGTSLVWLGIVYVMDILFHK